MDEYVDECVVIVEPRKGRSSSSPTFLLPLGVVFLDMMFMELRLSRRIQLQLSLPVARNGRRTSWNFLGQDSLGKLMAGVISPSRPRVMADMSNPRPMVNSKLLRKYTGRVVTTVVKVRRVEGGNVIGELPDGAPITVHRAPPHVAAQSMFMEVIGVVESERFLRAQTCTGFGDDFDILVYNELLQLMSTESRELFI